MVWIKRRHLKLHCREDIRKMNVSFQGLTESPAFIWLFPVRAWSGLLTIHTCCSNSPHWSLFWGGTFLPSRDSSSELIGLDLWAPVWKRTLSLSLDNDKSGGATRKRIRVKQLKGLIWQICATSYQWVETQTKMRWPCTSRIIGTSSPIPHKIHRYKTRFHQRRGSLVSDYRNQFLKYGRAFVQNAKMLRTSKQCACHRV